MPLLKNQKFAFSLFWAPLLVLGIIVATGELLNGRYRFLSVTALTIVFLIAVVLEAYTLFEERHYRYARALIAAGLLVMAVTAVEIDGVVHLIGLLVVGGRTISGTPLLLSGAYYWASNVLTFGLWFWLIDRGGPHMRAENAQNRPDFFFPEMAAGKFADPQWMPGLIEYAYLAFTNATAFSPTDTLPLTPRARVLMTAESVISLVIIALITARAVNILR